MDEEENTFHSKKKKKKISGCMFGESLALNSGEPYPVRCCFASHRTCLEYLLHGSPKLIIGRLAASLPSIRVVGYICGTHQYHYTVPNSDGWQISGKGLLECRWQYQMFESQSVPSHPIPSHSLFPSSPGPRSHHR